MSTPRIYPVCGPCPNCRASEVYLIVERGTQRMGCPECEHVWREEQ